MLEKKGTILSVREDLKVFDCTIRDGGLVNNFYFSDEFVRAHYEMCVASGVDYMEIGKNVSPTLMSEDEYGPWNFCKEEDIRRIVGENKTDLKIAVMSDIGRSLKEELRPKEQSVVDMIRIATYIHQIPAAIELIEDAHAKGYETTVNIMAEITTGPNGIKIWQSWNTWRCVRKHWGDRLFPARPVKSKGAAA